MAKKNVGHSSLEFLETPEGLSKEFGKAEGFIQRYNKLFLIIGGVLLLGLAAFVGYRYYIAQQEDSAQEALSNAVYDFEADSLKQALNGIGGNEGLLSITDDFKGTDASNLAEFYAGAALLQEGKFDEAIARLNAFNSEDYLLGARVKALIGDAYLEKNDIHQAIEHYKAAAGTNPNAYFTPAYQIKLAMAYRLAKQPAEAIKVLKELIDKYPSSSQTMDAKRYLGIIEAEAGK